MINYLAVFFVSGTAGFLIATVIISGTIAKLYNKISDLMRERDELAEFKSSILAQRESARRAATEANIARAAAKKSGVDGAAKKGG